MKKLFLSFISLLLILTLTVCKKDFKIEVRDCLKSDVTEIDNYSELVIIDPSYVGYTAKN